MSTPHGNTTAESVRNLIKKNPKYSKRINYDALKDLFIEGGGPPSFAANMGLSDDKDEAELYTIGDDKSDDEHMVIIEEGPGTVALPPPARKPEEDLDADADEGSDDGAPNVGWEDAYEQEL